MLDHPLCSFDVLTLSILCWITTWFVTFKVACYQLLRTCFTLPIARITWNKMRGRHEVSSGTLMPMLEKWSQYKRKNEWMNVLPLDIIYRGLIMVMTTDLQSLSWRYSVLIRVITFLISRRRYLSHYPQCIAIRPIIGLVLGHWAFIRLGPITTWGLNIHSSCLANFLCINTWEINYLVFPFNPASSRQVATPGILSSWGFMLTRVWACLNSEFSACPRRDAPPL